MPEWAQASAAGRIGVCCAAVKDKPRAEAPASATMADVPDGRWAGAVDRPSSVVRRRSSVLNGRGRTLPSSLRHARFRPRPALKHAPNVLTVLRIVLTPVVLVGVWRGGAGGYALATVVFVVAAISDWLDGHLARRHATDSRIGRFLDPLADKILVLGTFAVLAARHPGIVPWWAVALIAFRDIGVTVLRSAYESRGKSLRTLPFAKTKTALQLTFLIAVLVFLTAQELGGYPGIAASWLINSPLLSGLLVVLVALTVGTGLMYAVRREETA